MSSSPTIILAPGSTHRRSTFRFRILTVVDDCTPECLALVADTSLSGIRVARELDRLMIERGKPKMVVSDNGSELTSNAILTWADHSRVAWHYIAPGKPTDNAYVESFNASARLECLGQHWFMDLEDAVRKVEDWRREYNEVRPHSAIGDRPPMSLIQKPRQSAEASKPRDSHLTRSKIRDAANRQPGRTQNWIKLGGKVTVEFEPPHGIKIHCLTTWRRSNRLCAKVRDTQDPARSRPRRSTETEAPFQPANRRIPPAKERRSGGSPSKTRLLAGRCRPTFSKSFFSFPPCPPFLDDLQRAESARSIGAVAGVT